MITIVHTNDIAEARRLTAEGYEPIECSFGCGDSVLGPLNMDHHGAESWREGVALRAYRDHAGYRPNGKFVVTGHADADATFAIAALAGYLPQGLEVLATLVNRVDTNPIGIYLSDEEHGDTLLLWNRLSSGKQDATAFYAGVDRWRSLTGPRPPKALLAAAKQEEALRVQDARTSTVIVDRLAPLAHVESPVWGFDVWYSEIADCIFAHTPEGNVTIGCASAEIAERIFGTGGLKNVFAHLSPAGWGGRETVGGSPRGMKITHEQAAEAFEQLKGCVV